LVIIGFDGKGGDEVKSRRLLVLTGILLVIGAIIAGCSSTANEGVPASDFTLPNLNGEQMSLSDFQGRPVLLTFWSIDCPHCRIQLPYLMQAYEEYSSFGLMVLGVNVGDSASRVEGFVGDNNVSIPVLLDGGMEISRAYHIPGVPTNFLIDRQGIIQEFRPGRFTDYDDLRKSLQDIL